MSHLLDVRSNGVHAFVSLVLAGWHKLGSVVHDILSRAEGENLSGTGFPVRLVDTTYDYNGVTYQSESKSLIRLDTGAELGRGLSEHYAPIQNSTLWDTVEPLLEADLARIETAGSLDGGKRVFILLQLAVPGDVKYRGGDDDRVTYLALSNVHDGSRSAVAFPTTVRIVCNNTETAAFALAKYSRAITLKIPHRGNAEGRFAAEASRVYARALEAYAAQHDAYEALKTVELSSESFRQYVLDVVLPVPAEEPESKRAKTEREKLHARRDELVRLWRHGIGQTGNGTAYDAWNAITEATTHNPDLFSGRNTGKQWDDALLFGNLGTVQSKVANSLSSLVTV